MNDFIKNNWKLILIIVLTALTAWMWFVYSDRGYDASLDSFVDIDQASFDGEYWQEVIENDGPQQAYQKFVEDTLSEKDSAVQHALAHRFGSLLYSLGGLENLGVCDASFTFGCFHSFLGDAIAKEGVDIIEELDEACNSAFTDGGFACQHGIGHGLLAYYGYDRNDLDKALDKCSLLTDQGPAAGCGGGVFMEYNFRTMLDPSGSDLLMREFDVSDPHEPCLDIDEEFITHCYNEQPNLWKHAFNWDYQKISSLCNEAPTDELQRICLTSLGYSTLVNNEYDIEKTKQACDEMVDDNAKLLCRFATGRGLMSDLDFNSASAVVACSGLSGEDYQSCVAKMYEE